MHCTVSLERGIDSVSKFDVDGFRSALRKILRTAELFSEFSALRKNLRTSEKFAWPQVSGRSVLKRYIINSHNHM